MEAGDGGWIRAETDGESPGKQPGLGEEPGLDGDDRWPAMVAEPSGGERWGHRGIPGFSARVAAAVAAVAVVAAAAGVAVGLFMIVGALSGYRGATGRGSMGGVTSGRARRGAAARLAGKAGCGAPAGPSRRMGGVV
jgi:hypothetical protein